MRLSASSAALFLGALIAAPGTVRGSVIVSEDFNYGGTPGVLTGDNGGTGFSAAWTGGDYTPTGLTFSSLDSAGGAYLSAGATRPLASAFSTAGDTYGSFLFQFGSSGAGVQMLGYGGSPGSNNQAGDQLRLQPSSDSTNAGGPLRPTVTAPGSGSSNAESALTTTDLALNTPYLYLFHYHTTGTASTVSAWVVTASQFDTFAAGGLSESALTAASIGSGSNQVSGRATSTGTDPANIQNLNFYQFGGSGTTFDRIRLSDASLQETASVPEPSTLAIGGLVALIGGGVAWRRRACRVAP